MASSYNRRSGSSASRNGRGRSSRPSGRDAHRSSAPHNRNSSYSMPSGQRSSSQRKGRGSSTGSRSTRNTTRRTSDASRMRTASSSSRNRSYRAPSSSMSRKGSTAPHSPKRSSRRTSGTSSQMPSRSSRSNQQQRYASARTSPQQSRRSSGQNLQRRSNAGRPRTIKMPQSNPRSKSSSSLNRSAGGRAAQQYRDVSRSSRPVSVSSVRLGDMPDRSSSRKQSKQGREHNRYTARIILALCVVAVFFATGFGLYSSNLFTIDQVVVEGVDHLTSQEMTDLAAVPAGSTLIRVDTQSIVDRLTSDPWVKSASVKRLFPHTLDLCVQERTIAATVSVTSSDKKSTETWAISSDGLWLMKIPDRDSDEAKDMSSQIFDDADNVLHITDVPYGVRPEEGTYCTDASVLNALNVVSGLTTDLANEVKSVSASGPENTVLTLDNNIQIAFGTSDSLREKERVCLQLMQQYPDQIAYINVRTVDRPTWRSVTSS